jgi:hypothetical protein
MRRLEQDEVIALLWRCFRLNQLEAACVKSTACVVGTPDAQDGASSETPGIFGNEPGNLLPQIVAEKKVIEKRLAGP